MNRKEECKNPAISLLVFKVDSSVKKKSDYLNISVIHFEISSVVSIILNKYRKRLVTSLQVFYGRFG